MLVNNLFADCLCCTSEVLTVCRWCSPGCFQRSAEVLIAGEQPVRFAALAKSCLLAADVLPSVLNAFVALPEWFRY